MNKDNCPKCNAEFEIGTRFCPNCDNVRAIIFGIISIIVWYAILQVKKNDVSAWSTLK